jgi:hypothetical protein
LENDSPQFTTTSPGQIPSSGKTLGHSTLAVILALGSSHPKVSDFIYIYTYIYIYLGTEMDIHQSSTKFIHQAVVMLLCPDATGGRGIFTP